MLRQEKGIVWAVHGVVKGDNAHMWRQKQALPSASQ
jgi:hypothetical protein